jgi:hypothetical protein
MADDYEERFRRHEAIMEGLARMMAAQHAMNERQDAMNERLTLAVERIDRTLAQQAEFNGDVRTTLARLETLVARMLQTEHNGRAA